MSRKRPISLDAYVNTLNHYRFEFLKRSDEYIARKNEVRALCQKKRLDFSEETYDLANNPVHGYIVPDENGTLRLLNGKPLEKVAMTGEQIIAKCEPPKPLEFTFKVNPYATIDEFNEALEQFKKDTDLAFKTAKKYGYAGSQTSYVVKNNGKIDYFRITESHEPFSYWERLLKAHDLKRDRHTNTEIGKSLDYPVLDALVKAVSVDLKEAKRLISCAKSPCFPYYPPQSKPVNSILSPKIEPPQSAITAFHKKCKDPSTQAAMAALKPRHTCHKI